MTNDLWRYCPMAHDEIGLWPITGFYDLWPYDLWFYGLMAYGFMAYGLMIKLYGLDLMTYGLWFYDLWSRL